MGIDNYYFNNIDGKLIPDNYWDFHLTSDNQGMSLPYATSCNDNCDLGVITDNDLVLWFDVSKTGTTTDGTSLTSLTEWTGVTITPSTGMTLSDFGLTGVDNGRVTGFTDTLIITSADTKMVLYPVTGYTIQQVVVSGYTSGTTSGLTICDTFYETSETFVVPSYQLIGTNNISGTDYNTYRLYLDGTGSTSSGLHTIYGNSGNTMVFPPAYNEPAPFGANIGGVPSAFWSIAPGSQWDSWLTVGLTDGNITSALSTVGLDFSTHWDSGYQTTLSGNSAAVFWLNPNSGPLFSSGRVCVAQITIPTGTTFNVKLNAQGISVSGEDWYQEDIEFTNGTPSTPQSPLPSGRVCYNDRADTNNSGSVDVADINNVLTAQGGSIITFSDEDINEDGILNVDDLQLVLNAYGNSIPLPTSTYTSYSATTTYWESGTTYNTTKGKYDYPWTYLTGTTVGTGCEMEESICVNGGFYQGFFKIDFEAPAPTTGVTSGSCGTVDESTIIKGDPNAKKYEIFPTTFEKGWTMETWIYPNTNCDTSTGSTTTLNDIYSGNTGFFFYIGTRAENKFQNVFSGESGHTTSTGLPLQPNIEVDEGLDGGQDWFSISEPNTIGGFNPFRDCDCVCPITGTTSSVTSGSSNTYCNQLGENALGFRITDDNKLGWRKVSVTGECRNNKFTITGNTIEEEYTSTSVIPTGNTPTLIQVVYIQGGEKNGLPAGTLKMFVNGRLVLKSKEFIGIQLRALNEWSDKQQGVPYNMSWGGGTQGLAESQTFGGPDPADSGLLLERNFAGTFLGELSQLRFYKRPFNVLELRNNLFSECNRYCVRSTFGGSQIIQPGSTLCGNCSSGTPSNYLLHDGTCYIITENGEKIIL